MLKYLFSLILISLSLTAIAQTDIDALNYSRWTSGATARSLAVGGAFGALGGDISTMNTNPAGLGVFRASEIALTPAFNLANVSADFNGNTVDTDKNKFRFAGVGAAFVQLNDDPGVDWKSVTWGISYNQLANLDKKFVYENTTTGSIVESFLEQSNGYEPEELFDPEWLAYETYLIDNPYYANEYTSPLDENSVVLKTENFESKGSVYDLALSVGSNYRHKLYIGATIGLPIINYEQETTYREEDINGTYNDFDELRYTSGYATTGIGVNLKIGAIYKINRTYRAGLAVHTPTNFGLTDTEFYLEMTKFPSDNPQERLEYGAFEYNLKTPWRVIASGSAVIRNMGFISADVEWLNYGKNEYSFSYTEQECPTCQADAARINEGISDKYRSAINARLGAEYTYNKLRARVGYAYYGNPFESDIDTESGVRHNVSFGIGVRPKSVYLDLAFVRNIQKELYVPYVTERSPNIQAVTNNIGNNTIVLTAGLKF